jgi:hypothetical protein
MDHITNFQQLQVWQAAHRLVLMVYQVTRALPPDERYGLVSQMRRREPYHVQSTDSHSHRRRS